MKVKRIKNEGTQAVNRTSNDPRCSVSAVYIG